MAFLRLCLLISAVCMVAVHSQSSPSPYHAPAVCATYRGCPRICLQTAKCEFGICQNCNMEVVTNDTPKDQEKLADLQDKTNFELPAEDTCNKICPTEVLEEISEDKKRVSGAFRYNGICTCFTTLAIAVPTA